MTPTAIIVIARNEGDRLKACLASLPADAMIIYVDSGSSDGSQAYARARGVDVVDLPTDTRFTAARARGAGIERIVTLGATLPYVQMLDGDCELAPGWLEVATAALEADSQLGAVCGRLRERYPDASLYNAMCDDEWNVPVGKINTVSGNALFRLALLREAGGYDAHLIAGEEIDLCLRIARLGYHFTCLDAAMGTHDAAMKTFGQWWRRTTRSGYAYAEHVARGGAASDPAWVRSLISIVLWSVAIPISAALAFGIGIAFGAPWLGAAILLFYPLQWLRMVGRGRGSPRGISFVRKQAALLLVGKFAQARGVIRYMTDRLTTRTPTLIDYKAGSHA
jgi:glycosyltransferase involved in cell wall biosynthesis